MDKIIKLIELLGINYEEPLKSFVTAIIVLVLILLFFNLLFRTINSGRKMLGNITNSLIILLFVGFFGVVFWMGYQNSKEPLRIVEFSSTKSKYALNEEVFFNIKTNKKAYFYLYTYNAQDKRLLLYPKDISKPYRVDGNTLIRPDNGFRIINNQNYRDEKVKLIVSKYPIKGAEKEMTPLSFSKMLADNNTTFTKVEKNQVDIAVISFEVSKPKFDITIDTKNIDYKLKEDIDIDVTSLTEGYGHIFEATPTKNITKITKEKFYNLEIRTGTTAKKPIGRHTVIAIFTEDNRDIKPTDFIIEEEIVKGEPNYSIRFKNGKRYEYDIQWFRVEGRNTGHGR